MILIGGTKAVSFQQQVPISILSHPFPRQQSGFVPSRCHFPVAQSASHAASCIWDDKILLLRRLDLVELYSLTSAELLKVHDNRNWAWCFKKSCRGVVIAKLEREDKPLIIFIYKHRKGVAWTSYILALSPHSDYLAPGQCRRKQSPVPSRWCSPKPNHARIQHTLKCQ